MDHHPSNHSPDQPHSRYQDDAPTWHSALANLIQSRIELIRLESHDAQKFLSSKLAGLSIAITAAITAWACLIIGFIGAVASLASLPWWGITLILGGLHLIIAMIAMKKMRTHSRPLFPVTRGEFHKDKLWMQTLKTPKHK